MGAAESLADSAQPLYDQRAQQNKNQPVIECYYDYISDHPRVYVPAVYGRRTGGEFLQTANRPHQTPVKRYVPQRWRDHVLQLQLGPAEHHPPAQDSLKHQPCCFCTQDRTPHRSASEHSQHRGLLLRVVLQWSCRYLQILLL